ncbi:MAG: NitT/TauT family transport system substrate-binding protein [Solirubrobacteraceae bacterium]
MSVRNANPRWGLRACLAAAAAVAALGVAACGSDSDSPSSTSTPAASSGTSSSETPTKTTSVTIGTVPSASALPILVAEKAGLFKQVGLDAKIQLIGTPSNSYPSLIANKIQVLIGTATTTITFNGNGAGVNIVAGYEVESTTADDDFFRVLALPKSGIKSVKDLAGKKVAVGQLNSLGTLSISGALMNAGLAPDAAKFVEIPFPNQLAALKAGQVDAMWQGEPFVTQSRAKEKLNLVCSCGFLTQPKIPVGAVTMTAAYEKQHPEVVTAIQKVMPLAYKYVQTHEDEARSLLKDFLKVDDATAKNMSLPPYVDSFPIDSFHQLEDLLIKLKYIKKIPPDSSVLNLG